MRLRLAFPRKAEKIDSAREREVRPPPPARDAAGRGGGSSRGVPGEPSALD